MALRFASFRYIKIIWFGLKNGRDESAPTPCGVHVAIYLRKKWILRCVCWYTFCAINEYYVVVCWYILRYPFRYFYLLYPTFRHVHPVGVGADLSCPCPRTPTKWRCIFLSLILQFIIPHQRNTLKWRCVSYHFDILKPFGLDCKTGAMNLPLRLAVCSLIYILHTINGLCGVCWIFYYT